MNLHYHDNSNCLKDFIVLIFSSNFTNVLIIVDIFILLVFQLTKSNTPGRPTVISRDFSQPFNRYQMYTDWDSRRLSKQLTNSFICAMISVSFGKIIYFVCEGVFIFLFLYGQNGIYIHFERVIRIVSSSFICQQTTRTSTMPPDCWPLSFSQ